MSRKYYIAADGGGSKLLAILYDESFKVVRSAKSTGVNTLFKLREEVERSIDALVEDLLRSDVTSIERVDACLVGGGGYFEKSLRARCEIKSFVFSPEPPAALGAAWMKDGIVALCGTGSDAFAMTPDGEYIMIGGRGPLLGDEGSGYDIGLRSLRAYVYEDDGRGEKTLMSDMIKEKFGIGSVNELVHIFVNNPDTRHQVASVAMITSKAAAMGDKVAIDIYKYAARELALDVCTAARRTGELWNGFVVTMGGVWKGSSVMFEEFKRIVLEKYPEATIVHPEFEPVVGCVVKRCFDEGIDIEKVREQIREGFADFRYKI